MKIMIIGSMTFAKEMFDTKAKLEELGHYVNLPCDAEEHLQDKELIDDLDKDLDHLIENNILRQCFDLLAESDAVLALNMPKNNIDGYMGTSTLMETALAYYLNKKIFIYNDIPPSYEQRWAHEIRAMEPTVIYGDLTKIQ